MNHLKAPYNKNLIAECRLAGARWDSQERSWVFGDDQIEKYRELGRVFNSEMVTAKITYVEECRVPIYVGEDFCGVPILKSAGYGRVKVERGVQKINGYFLKVGDYIVIDKGTEFILKLPRLVLEKYYFGTAITYEVVKGDCSSLRGDCAALEEYSANLKGDCSSLRGDCTDLEEYSASLKGGCSDLRGDCTDLEEYSTSLKGDCTNLKKKTL